MYPELAKFATGRKLPAEMEINGQKVKIELDAYEAGLGDLINDFIAHKTRTRWVRKPYHNHLTELYLKILNQITITHGF